MYNLADNLQRAADIMHWFEKHDVASALALMARLLRAKRIDSITDLCVWVEEIEKNSAPTESPEPAVPGAP